MAKVWYFCVTPDWRRPQRGLFVANPSASNPYYQFWYNQTDSEFVNPAQPPSLQAGDTVGFAVEMVPDVAHAPYAVDQIMVMSSVQNNPIGPGAVPAQESEAFKDGNVPVSHARTTTPADLMVRDIDAGPDRPYKVLRPVPVYANGSHRKEAHEIGIMASLQDKASHQSHDFSCDPEMDVNT